METLYKEGLVRAIGVCNFHENHLERLLEIADVVPAINQVELHPLLSQANLVEFCNKFGITMMAYSPLARMNERLINNGVLIGIARKHEKTVPQIVLRWDYQRQIVSIPKSSNPSRLKQNMKTKAKQPCYDLQVLLIGIGSVYNYGCEAIVRGMS